MKPVDWCFKFAKFRKYHYFWVMNVLKTCLKEKLFWQERGKCFYLFIFSSFSKELKICFYFLFIFSCTCICVLIGTKKVEYVFFLEYVGLILEIFPGICSQGLSRNSDCRGARVERLHSRFKWCCELGWNAYKYTMVFWGQYDLLIQPVSYGRCTWSWCCS